MSQFSNDNLDQNILNDYYQALQCIDDQHKQMVNAKQELYWHENQLSKSNELARQFGVNDLSGLPLTRSITHTNTDRNRVNTTLNNAFGCLDQWNKLKIEKNNALDALKQKLKQTIEDLQNQLSKTIKELNEVDTNIDKHKTQKMIYVILTVIVAVSVTIAFNNFLATIIITCLFLAIISWVNFD